KEAVERLLAQTHTKATDLAGIAFPGQTLWHEPPLVSLQLGEPAVLVEEFGAKVISGFPAGDIAAGGEGAPLVPMAALELVAATTHARVLLNIGGMANVTFVPKRGVHQGVIAFDTGPGVAVIDAVARMIAPELPYDRDGQVSAQGKVDEKLLQELLADP